MFKQTKHKRKTDNISTELLFNIVKKHWSHHSTSLQVFDENLKNDDYKSQLIRKQRYSFSKAFSGLNVECRSLLELVNDLKYYFNLCGRRDFLQMLVNLVRPIGKALAIFDYGELLAYLPLVKSLLNDMVITEDIAERKETITIKLGANKEMLVVLKHTPTGPQYSIYIDDELCSCLRSDSNGTESGPESLSKILSAFEEYVKECFTVEESSKIPVVSFPFIFHLCRCLLNGPLQTFERWIASINL